MRVWQGERSKDLKEFEEVSHVDVWGKNVPGSMNSGSKGPGTGACLV